LKIYVIDNTTGSVTVTLNYSDSVYSHRLGG